MGKFSEKVEGKMFCVLSPDQMIYMNTFLNTNCEEEKLVKDA